VRWLWDTFIEFAGGLVCGGLGIKEFIRPDGNPNYALTLLLIGGLVIITAVVSNHKSFRDFIDKI